jgi:hypothetical protein
MKRFFLFVTAVSGIWLLSTKTQAQTVCSELGEAIIVFAEHFPLTTPSTCYQGSVNEVKLSPLLSSGGTTTYHYITHPSNTNGGCWLTDGLCHC